MSYSDIERALMPSHSGERGPEGGNALEALGVRPALDLAWLLFVQQLEHSDLILARSIYAQWAAEHPGAHLRNRHRRAAIEVALALCETAEALALLTEATSGKVWEELLFADALNPFRPGNVDRAIAPWITAINSPFRRDGVDAITLNDHTELDPFDRLATVPVPTTAREATVSVIVSAYRPDSRLTGSVRSIVASSWLNTEIIVVDDGSGREFDGLLDEVGGLDPRVRVVRLTSNGGTYRARNHAMGFAKGDFVTFHDSDDWMHPRRLEQQALHLLHHPEDLANISLSSRVTDRLEFSNSRNLGVQTCEPSIMFRRDIAIATFGYFDETRKGADAEYRRRIEAVGGRPIPVVGRAPLTFQRVGEKSLSNSDIVRHWFHVDRRVYRSCYEQWHASEIAHGRVPRLDAGGGIVTRPFYAPPALGGEPSPSTFDFIFASNWLERGSWDRQDSALEKCIQSLVQQGKTVAIVHLPWLEPLRSMHLALAPTMSRLLNETALEFVSGDTVVHSRVLVANYAPRVQMGPHARSLVSADQCIAVSDTQKAAFGSATGGLSVAQRLLVDMYGIEPRWLTARRLYAELLGDPK